MTMAQARRHAADREPCLGHRASRSVPAAISCHEAGTVVAPTHAQRGQATRTPCAGAKRCFFRHRHNESSDRRRGGADLNPPWNGARDRRAGPVAQKAWGGMSFVEPRHRCALPPPRAGGLAVTTIPRPPPPHRDTTFLDPPTRGTDAGRHPAVEGFPTRHVALPLLMPRRIGARTPSPRAHPPHRDATFLNPPRDGEGDRRACPVVEGARGRGHRSGRASRPSARSTPAFNGARTTRYVPSHPPAHTHVRSGVLTRTRPPALFIAASAGQLRPRCYRREVGMQRLFRPSARRCAGAPHRLHEKGRPRGTALYPFDQPAIRTGCNIARCR